jgi:hypothetical protein
MIVYFLPTDEASGYTWGAVDPRLQISHTYHRSNVRGGPSVAECAVLGPLASLWELLTWLRRPVEIYSDNGECVWWGITNEVRLTVGGITVGVSLDAMYNRVKVIYSTTGPDGAAIRGAVNWAQDDDSVDRYGYKEALVTLGEADADAAAAHQAAILAAQGKPRGVPSAGQAEEPVATVICVGWYETLRWRTFGRSEGRSEFDTTTTETHSVGWGLTSTQIGFAAEGIHHLGAQLGALGVGDQVIVSGSGSNNGTRTLVAAATGEQEVYTATTISFDPADDINDSANGLGFIETDYLIQVAGSSANSGVHLVETSGAGHIAIVEALSASITTEAAGPSITITQGQRATLSEAVTDELPGANVTLAMVGVQVAQSFVAQSSYFVGRIAVPIGRIGEPTDELWIDLMTNNVSGNPGGLLERIAITGADLTQDDQPFRWVEFAGTTAITSGTTYWIRIRRSSSNSAVNYYSVGMTDEVSGACKVWDGSNWLAHPRGLYIPYRVWGTEENATQVAQIVSTSGQFFAGTDMAATGIATHQWRDGDLTAYDELEKLLDQGDSQGRRLLATVTRQRYLRVYPEPDRHTDGDRILRNGQLRNVAGGRRQRGLLPTGEWLVVDELPGYLNDQLDISPLFVDEAAWAADSPDIFEIRPKAAFGEI